MEKVPITTVKTVLVTTVRITIIKKILMALKYKKDNKNKYYRLYQQQGP